MPRVYLVKRHEVIQPLDEPYRLIALTQNQTAIVDVSDFEWLSKWRWQAHWNPNTKSFYAFRGDGIYMHRLILGCSGKEQGDHKNHNTLDNRKENLRKCTNSANRLNTKKRSTNKSGFKGVYWCKRSNRWIARIQKDGKVRHIGAFHSLEAAARAYDAAALLHHGEFAHLNFQTS